MKIMLYYVLYFTTPTANSTYMLYGVLGLRKVYGRLSDRAQDPRKPLYMNFDDTDTSPYGFLSSRAGYLFF